MKALTVEYERWEDGWWIARIPAVKGVHSNGRTIEEARRRVRDALSVATDEGWNARKAAAVELVDDIRLPGAAKTAIERRAKAMAALAAAAARVETDTAEAVRALVDRAGLGFRDTGALLGLSHQRVHQIAEELRKFVPRGHSIVAESEARYDLRSASSRRRRR